MEELGALILKGSFYIYIYIHTEQAAALLKQTKAKNTMTHLLSAVGSGDGCPLKLMTQVIFM